MRPVIVPWTAPHRLGRRRPTGGRVQQAWTDRGHRPGSL